MHFPQIHGGLSVKGSPFGGAGERSETERARPLTANPRHCDSIALTKSLPITAPAALSCRACPLRHLRCHCPGCGSQRLLRCRSHPAGRGPNSSSLFPPLAAVVAVAPKGRGFGRPHRSLYLFGELYVIMVLRFTPRISRERRWTRWPIFSHFWYLSEQM